MKIVVIAAEGMLGTAWTSLTSDHEIVPARYPDVDITRPETLSVLEGADVVVNCAAWTDVDGAEEHEERAALVNGAAVRTLSELCAKQGALLVHYSTDYVFSGDASSPYPIDASIDPVNAYGRTKALGERALVEGGAEHLLIRTSWVYAPWGKNFVLTMAKLGRERDALSVVNDQRGRPTSAPHLAATSLRLIEAGARGTFHVTDGGQCTWFELASHIVSRVNPDCTVEPCTSDAFPRPAPRPSYSVLDLSRTEQLLGSMPSWETHVDDVLDAL